MDIWNWNTIYLCLISSTTLLMGLTMTALCVPPVPLLYMILRSLRGCTPPALTFLDGYTPQSVIWQLALNFAFMIYFSHFCGKQHTATRILTFGLYPSCISCPRSADGGEVELLPFDPRSCTPTLLRGHWGGATQRDAAEEDWPVDPREGKASDQTGWLMVD